MVSALAKAHFGHVSTDSCTRSLIVMAPIRTGVASLIYCLTIDGYPALAVALRRASTFVLASSKVTTASVCSSLAATFPTPSTFFNALLTVIGHTSQSMPGTLSVTVLFSAYAGMRTKPNRPPRARTTELRFINALLVKKSGRIREPERDQHHRGHDPEQHFVDAAALRDDAESPRLAGLGCGRRVNLPVGEHHA